MITAQAEKAPRPLLCETECEIPLITGSRVPYVNLDYAASTPALNAVWDAIKTFIPWYSSVHRGTGFKSQVSTAAYEGAREAIGRFIGARPDDAIIFTRNTTDSINLLASCLPPESRIIASSSEHLANMLPWRRHQVDYLPFAANPQTLLESLAASLREIRAPSVLVTVTGASNVTGEIWPIGEIAELAHRFGARILVDAAQLAPHVPIDMTALDIDYLTFSGHKLYAPFGSGVLVGRPDWLQVGPPFLRGGGAVRLVTLDDALWADLPDRQEAGSPNVVGAVALGVACETLQRLDMHDIAEEEMHLRDYARVRLAAIPGLAQYTLWDHSHPHIGVLTWNLEGYEYGLLAAILSAEYGIGVRHGRFCAHPLMLHLLQVDRAAASAMCEELKQGRTAAIPGAVRMSIGLGSAVADIDRLVDALSRIVRDGPSWKYRSLNGSYLPDPETRHHPKLPISMSREFLAVGESS